MSLTLLEPASLLQHALLLLMEGVQEGKLSHALATSITIPLSKGSHVAKLKSRVAEVHSYPHVAMAEVR